MSSLRRTLSSRANGALSRGPVTIDGKKRSAMNALSHGLLARTTLMRGEWADGLENIFNKYVDRLAPVDAVEYAYVEEMVAASWRLRRLWAIETRTLDNEVDAQTDGDIIDRMAAAFAQLAEKPHPDLLHRYELRMHLTYQRALQNLILLRIAGTNEPSPISGHSTGPKPAEPPEPPVSRSHARQQTVVSSASSPPAASPHLPVAPSPGRNVGSTPPPVEQAVLPNAVERAFWPAKSAFKPSCKAIPLDLPDAATTGGMAVDQRALHRAPPVQTNPVPFPDTLPSFGAARVSKQSFRPRSTPGQARLPLTYQRALHNLPLLRTAGTNEPSPISGHSGPEPTVAPKPPVFRCHARQQAVVFPRVEPPGCIPPISPSPHLLVAARGRHPYPWSRQSCVPRRQSCRRMAIAQMGVIIWSYP